MIFQALEKSLAFHRALADKLLGENGHTQFKTLSDGYDFETPPAFNVQKDGDTLNVFVDEPLDPWYLDLTAMTREIRNASEKNITVHVNSVGGSVIYGIDIFSALRFQAEKNGAAITTINNGVVSSAAVLPYLAGDTRYAGEGLGFVHNVQSIIFGGFSNDAEVDALAAEAKRFRSQMQKQMVAIYMDRLSMKEKDVQAALNAETLYTAKEFHEQGYATDAGFPSDTGDAVAENTSPKVNAALASMRGMLAVRRAA